MTHLPDCQAISQKKFRKNEKVILGLILQMKFIAKGEPLTMPEFLPSLLHLRSNGYDLDIFSDEGLDGNGIYDVLDLLEAEGLALKEKSASGGCSGTRYFYLPGNQLNTFLTSEIVGSVSLETMAADILCSL